MADAPFRRGRAALSSTPGPDRWKLRGSRRCVDPMRAWILALGATIPVLLWLTAASSARALTLLIGESSGSVLTQNFIPFGGVTPLLAGQIDQAIGDGEQPPAPRYQQVYDSGSFSQIPQGESAFVKQIRFFEVDPQVPNAGLIGGTSCADGLPPCGTATLRIGTTKSGVGVDNLNEDFDNFAGTSIILVENVLLSSLSSNGVLEFAGNPYEYDPSLGDLLIDIQFHDFQTVADLDQGLNALFFRASRNTGAPVYSLVDNFSGNDNSSWNCGAEGPSDDPEVLALRACQRKNLAAMLFLAQGAPMIQSGDEFGRTRGGNNNAYCHDRDWNWIDWSAQGENDELFRFFRRLIEFRNQHPALRRREFFEENGVSG